MNVEQTFSVKSCRTVYFLLRQFPEAIHVSRKAGREIVTCSSQMARRVQYFQTSVFLSSSSVTFINKLSIPKSCYSPMVFSNTRTFRREIQPKSQTQS